MANPNRSNWWRHAGEVERLKASADLVGLIRAHGVELKPEGADLVGLCPFHSETTPSFRVTPSKNLYHCFGCGKGGSVVDWLVSTRGVSIREAFEQLRASSGAVVLSAGEAEESAIEADPSWSDGRLLGAVADYYASRLGASPTGREYLTKRGLWDEGLVRRFRLGLSDRTLGNALERHAEGTALRERLTDLGVFRENGREHLNGSLVVPILSEIDGMGVCEVSGLYGRKVGSRLRPGTPLHLYLKGEHRGVFNASGIRASLSSTVVLCESLLDALTLIRWGIEPVTTAYGVHGVTPDLWRFLTESGFCRVVLAFDSDEAGDRAAQELAPRLDAQGLEVQRLRLPAGHDVNSYALACSDPSRALREALSNAVWMGESLYSEDETWKRILQPVKSSSPDASLSARNRVPSPALAVTETVAIPKPPKAEESETQESTPQEPQADRPSSLAVPPSAAAAPAALPDAPTPAAFVATDSSPLDAATVDTATVDATFGDRLWRVKGLSRNRTDDVLRVTLRVSRAGGSGYGGFHLDTLDLYQAKSRDTYARAASVELGVDLDVIRADLARLIVTLEERLQAALRATREPPAAPERTLAPAERDEALALLRRPDMLRQLLTDLEASGMVGEEENKLLCWLALTSRHLDAPLGVLIQSSSAAGKSSLLDGVLRTMPEEAVVRYSAMSGQALFYMGGVSLRHKVLCVAEEEGARRASYSLKLLQSDGELSMASTGKDPDSGQLVTREYKTEGPVALAMTTTSLDIDPELQNRCLVLSVDESREQTEAIHARQRLGRTRLGVVDRRAVSERLAVWRNAQRLLRPLDVVNPYAEDLTFSSHRTRTRRDMAKYLTLVNAVALAHQHQKPLQRDEHGEYIEVDLDDIELANRLAVRGLGLGLQELSGLTERVLQALRAWVRERAASEGIAPELVRFTRRDLLGRVSCGSTQLKMHLRALVEHEVVSVVRGRNGVAGSVQYALEACDGGDHDHAMGAVGLLDVRHLRARHPRAKYAGTWSAGGVAVGALDGSSTADGGDDAHTTPTRSAPGRHPVGCENRPGCIVPGNGHKANGDAVSCVTGIVSEVRNGHPVGSVGKSHIGTVKKNRTPPVVVSSARPAPAAVLVAAGSADT